MNRTVRVIGAVVFLATAAASHVNAADAVDGDHGRALDDYLSGCEAMGFSGAALVATKEGLVLSRGYGHADPGTSRVNTPGTLFDIGSLTKQFTAALVLSLEEQGVLRTDETLRDFVPEMPDDKAGITLHHLLTHTSSLPPDIPAGSMTTRRAELVQLVRDASMQGAPGGPWHYNNIGYCLIAALLEIRTGRSYETLMHQHVFAPAGMDASGFLGEAGFDPGSMAHGTIVPGSGQWGPAVDGWYSWGLRGAGGVLSTVEDLYKWEQALRTPGKVLAEASLEKLFTGYAKLPFGGAYAYGWNVVDLEGHRWLEHGGDTRGFHAKFYRFPDDETFVVWLSNNAKPDYMIPVNLARAALGLTYQGPPKPFAMTPEQLAAIAGTYTSDKGNSLRLEVERGSLWATPEDPGAVGLLRGADHASPKIKSYDERGAAVIAGILTNRPEDIAEILTTRFDNSGPWPQRLVPWLRTIRGGALESGSVLGTVTIHGRPQTWGVLEFESGPFFVGLVWDPFEDRVVAIAHDEPLPLRSRLIPASAEEFVVFDMSSMREQARVRVETDPAGKPTRLIVTVGDKRSVLDREGH